jgi:hypothetical protein
MSRPAELDEHAIEESVRRVHDEIITVVLRSPSRVWGRNRRWPLLGLAAILIFGGGLATGAAYASTVPTIPAGLLRIQCASGESGSASTAPGVPRQSVQYFDRQSNTLVAAPPVKVTTSLEKDPTAACGSEIPKILSSIGAALPAFASVGDHCGTVTVPGYPKAYFVADGGTGVGADYSSEAGPFALNLISADAYAYLGPVATNGCVDLTMPVPVDANPMLVACAAASNDAVVYSDDHNSVATAVCKRHGYSPWKS